MNSRQVIKKLRKDGWEWVRVRGDHHQFKHSERTGLVTVQHPEKDLSIEMIRSIERQSGTKLK